MIHSTLRALPFIAVSLLVRPGSLAQCTNPSQFPSNSIVPNAGGAETSITTCNWEAEHARITSIIAGAAYRFTIASGSFITVHQDVFDGPVLGYGNSPLTVVAATSGDLFVHWNVNSSCATAMNCYPTTVQLFLNCLPPQFTYSTTNDCDNSQFYLNVNVVDTGDASSLALTYTVNGGAPVTQTGVGIGSYQFGPFPNLALVDLTVEHADDATCNQTVNDITNFPCPILGCGPDNYTHCYGNNEEYVRTFQSTSSYPMRLEFLSGGVSTFGEDPVTIYDGLNDSSPQLYTGSGNAGDLTGLVFTSMNLDQALTLKMVSSAFTSCADNGSIQPWNYRVGCLDCTNPAASFAMVPDCQHNGFLITTDVTDLGTASDLRLVDSWSLDTLDGVGLGTTTVGPFPVGQNVHVTLVNSSNVLCRIVSPAFTLPQSQCVITACENLNVDYCYANEDTAWFVYQSGTTTPITLSLNEGQLLPGDILMIYNGIGDIAQLVFAGDLGGQIGGFALTSNNAANAITMKVASNASGSCATGEASPALQWTVGCGLVGVEGSTSTAFSIFPNPASTEVTVFWPSQWGSSVHWEMIDMTGRRIQDDVFFGGAGGHTLNVGGLSEGSYLLRLSTPKIDRALPFRIIR